MKLKKASGGPAKIPIDMTPMIDCVFQLIIFFMLTLKIRANEGDSGKVPNSPPSRSGSKRVPMEPCGISPSVNVRWATVPGRTPF
jgi:biopolymer transport protein ExbD